MQTTASSIGINSIQGAYGAITVPRAHIMLATYGVTSPTEAGHMTHAHTFCDKCVPCMTQACMTRLGTFDTYNICYASIRRAHCSSTRVFMYTEATAEQRNQVSYRERALPDLQGS